MVASMSGGTYFAYKYVTSEQFKTRVMNEILGNVQGMMPKVLEKGLPDLTGPSITNTTNRWKNQKWKNHKYELLALQN